MVPIFSLCSRRTRSRSGSRAIVPSSLHDLADHRRRREAGEPRQVAARLGVSGAHQHAAGLRDEREDVARLHDVVRAARRARPRPAPCARGRRGDAGGDAFGGLDRDGEVGAVRRAVVRHHRRQVELPAALLGERQADRPRPCFAMKLIFSGVTKSAANTRSPSFSRSSSSTRMTHPAGLDVGDDLGDGAKAMACERRSADRIVPVRDWRRLALH